MNIMQKSKHKIMPLTHSLNLLVIALLGCFSYDNAVYGFSGGFAASHLHFANKKVVNKPKLILITGPPGTGKSTFGMSVALDQGILRCISTDTVRAVMRTFVEKDVSPALHRSSYAEAYEGDCPVRSWKEACLVIRNSVDGLVDDAINRGVSLVVEGVHVMPSSELIQRWEESGGVAIGCLLKIEDATIHQTLLRRRGFITGNVDKEEEKIRSFDRVREIQSEMMRLADEAGWLQIEQNVEPTHLEQVGSVLYDLSVDCENNEDCLPDSILSTKMSEKDFIS